MFQSFCSKNMMGLPINWMHLVLAAVVVSMLVRAFMALLRGLEPVEGKSRRTVFADSLLGRGNDYWTAFVLGILEFSAYVVCLNGSIPKYIGAWIVLKALPHIGHKGSGLAYNRFLIGNLLIVAAAYVYTRWLG